MMGVADEAYIKRSNNCGKGPRSVFSIGGMYSAPMSVRRPSSHAERNLKSLGMLCHGG